MLEAQGAMMGPAILDYTVNGNEWDAMGYDEILGAAICALRLLSMPRRRQLDHHRLRKRLRNGRAWSS